MSVISSKLAEIRGMLDSDEGALDVDIVAGKEGKELLDILVKNIYVYSGIGIIALINII